MNERFTAYDRNNNARYEGIRWASGTIELFEAESRFARSTKVTEENLQKYYRVVEK